MFPKDKSGLLDIDAFFDGDWLEFEINSMKDALKLDLKNEAHRSYIRKAIYELEAMPGKLMGFEGWILDVIDARLKLDGGRPTAMEFSGGLDVMIRVSRHSGAEDLLQDSLRLLWSEGLIDKTILDNGPLSLTVKGNRYLEERAKGHVFVAAEEAFDYKELFAVLRATKTKNCPPSENALRMLLKRAGIEPAVKCGRGKGKADKYFLRDVQKELSKRTKGKFK